LRDGIEKISRAKGLSPSKANRKKPTVAEADIMLQLSRSSKRLQVLKHEMQKRKLQLQNLQVKLDEEGQKNGKSFTRDSVKVSTVLRTPMNSSYMSASYMPSLPSLNSGLTHISGQVNERDGIIRVSMQDAANKTDAIKTIFLTSEDTSSVVISMILQKFNVQGDRSEYALGFFNEHTQSTFTNTEDEFLQNGDMPLELDMNLADCVFKLVVT
jgi:hypothetical protein